MTGHPDIGAKVYWTNVYGSDIVVGTVTKTTNKRFTVQPETAREFQVSVDNWKSIGPLSCYVHPYTDDVRDRLAFEKERTAVSRMVARLAFTESDVKLLVQSRSY